jgi:uncharacterized protein
MYRKYYNDLLDWKDRGNRKPLVIRGARQVGKTYLVRQFGREQFEHFIEINFDETPRKRELFQYESIDRIIEYISLDTGIPVIPGRTLIFLDEIQRAPEIFAKLRYFFEKRKDIHIITAGSLLDFILAEHTFSMPVGRIEYLYMGPMDIIEFLTASGDNSLSDFLRQFRMNDPVPAVIHEKLLELTRTYMGIGGMPSAVREHVESGSLRKCEMELSSILSTLRDDFSKYGKKADPFRLQLVLDKTPGLVGKKVKYTEISRDEKSENLKESLYFLELARLIYRVYHSSGNAVPLRAERKERNFKLLFLDIGLMMRSLGLNLLSLKDENVIMANKGALAEQFIGQQWLYGGESYVPPELYYWNREKTGATSEVDYLFEVNGRIVPAEIKSGTAGSLKSLHVFASLKKTATAIRFNTALPSISTVEAAIPGMEKHPYRLLSLPLYMVSEARRLIKECSD